MSDLELAKRLFLEGVTRMASEDYQGALSCLRDAHAITPDRPSVLINLAAALVKVGKQSEAHAFAIKATVLAPDSSEAWLNLGACESPHLALEAYQRALAVQESADAWLGCATSLMAMRRYERALVHLDAALKLSPALVEACLVRAACLHHLKRSEEALDVYRHALTIDTGLASGWFNFGNFLQEIKRYPEAVEAYSRAHALNPDVPFVLGHIAHSRMLCCDWRDYAGSLNAIKIGLLAGRATADPFGYQALSADLGELRRCAEIFAQNKLPVPQPSTSLPKDGNAGRRIRVGYVAGEFRQQATSILAVELFELHDKSRFTITAFDSGWDDGSATRQRIVASFDELVDVSRMSDDEMIGEIQRRGIDILVNLNGYFGLTRNEVFCARPSPIQVNYLGFPGTLGSPCLDYIIADDWVIPEGHYDGYVEKVVCLPNSYQVNDSQRPIADVQLSRAQFGLPAKGFVFCCFNNNYKITPDVFAQWMRILLSTPGSVLWLIEDSPDAAANLRKEAQSRGLDASRLVFAQREELPLHLARHSLADLFLDTLPYNAHTTASDALWAGLPVLTCLGCTFPGRVAASLLDAVGLPELITRCADDYETLAVSLAHNPVSLAELRQRLAVNRLNMPLFDARRYTRDLEAAYGAMFERWQAGLLPAAIRVESAS